LAGQVLPPKETAPMPARVEILSAPKVGRGYSSTTAHGTKAGGFVFVTGQVAVTPGQDGLRNRAAIGEMGAIETQTVQVLENIKAILEAAGTSFEHVVKRNVYLTHPADFDAVHKILERYFKPVATTTVVTGLIPVSSRVEIDVIAVVPD
jgi:2-iminobutanoate/2-iminopropanoate deaminase